MIALGPSKTLGSLRVTFAKILLGERLLRVRINFGVVEQPKLQRIHLQLVSEFIHGDFKGIGAGRNAGRAHISRRSKIEGHEPMNGCNIRAVVHHSRRECGRFEIVLDDGSMRMDFVADGGEFAFTRGAQRDVLMRSRDGRPQDQTFAAAQATSLTGRFTCRAAMAARITCDQICPLQPKPPPTNRLIT